MKTTPDLRADVPVPEDDPRLLRATQAYLALIEAGQRPDRAAFLAQYPDLRAELPAYLDTLDAVHAASPVVANLSAGRRRASPIGEMVAEPLGDFRLGREIGRGGMGVVYEAVQLSLGRRVALKVLPLAAALDSRQLQRFKNEAQAAAHLHHPNIVPVYYVGVERGVHFYAMQYIEGQNLAVVVENLRETLAPAIAPAPARTAHQRPGVRTEPALPPEGVPPVTTETGSVLGGRLSTERSRRPSDFFRTIARLVAQVASALSHAHSLGIVHRDIKPANLLVDGSGTVWITDFGLAQFHGDAGLTQTGDLLGTLRYMSPEQAGGQRVLIDHRTDIYSLGATLYELLTLRPIFDGSDRQTLLRQILNDEPTPPRSIDPAIPSELETILLKATAKAPSERYTTAQDFADDLQRFLSDQPIRARRPTLADKVTKWARRHRGMVLSAVLALLVTVAGLSVSMVLTAWAYERESQKAIEAAEQRTRAEQNLLVADEQRQRAVDGLRQARHSVDFFIQISEEELSGNPAVEGLRKRLLEAALHYYQEFLDQRSEDPMLQAELESSRARAETILRELTTLIGARSYNILRQESVQKELHITPEQKKTLNGIDERARRTMEELGRLSGEARDRRFLALAQTQEEEVGRLLDPAQLRRFKQLAILHMGLRAFSEPDIITALSLTTDQKRRVRELQDEANGPPRFGPGFGGPGGFNPRQAREQSLTKILDLLAPTQKKKWTDLAGEPFTFDNPRFPGLGRRLERASPARPVE